MDPKSEAFYHMALLACMKPVNVATRKNNKEMRHILGKFGSFEEAYSKLNLPIPNERTADEIRKAEKFVGKLDLDFNMLTFTDLRYPDILKENDDTAPVLYYRGNIDLLKRDSIAVVGTRAPLSQVECSEAQKALADIVKKDYVIVSGLASGCDTLGHRAGLEKGTIAVLGTALNRSYPKENKDLQEKIAQEHLLVTQYPIGIDRFLYYKTEQPLNFKKRNQTTVGLSNKGVLVLKTADKGGTQNAVAESQNFSLPLYAMRCNFNPDNTWTEEFDWEDHGIVRKVK